MRISCASTMVLNAVLPPPIKVLLLSEIHTVSRLDFTIIKLRWDKNVMKDLNTPFVA